MSDAIRIWGVDGDQLSEIPRQAVDLESRLEDWMDADVSVLSDDLLVIGRQLDTEGGGTLDLLCLDRNGDMVVVELKRGKTPREVIAQVLDYAAWAADLSFDQIQDIASNTFPDGLDDAFRQRFDADLPDVLNADHHLLVVASEIDPRSERIIRYLAETHGVRINAVTFNYFRAAGGGEFLARTHLIEPDDSGGQARRKPGSKRRPDATLEDHQREAARLGVEEVFAALAEGILRWFDAWAGKTVVSYGRRGKWLVMFRVLSSKSEPGVLAFDSSENRLGDAFGLSTEEVLRALPSGTRPISGSYEDGSSEGFAGTFRTSGEVSHFLATLAAAPRQPGG